MFLPPINLGSFKPSPATLAQWVYDIWQYLQENPIATQEDITTYIQNYFETSPEVQEVVGDVVAQYLLDNPPQAPVQSVQGKTGAVSLTYPDIVPASNAVPVYRAASAPNVSTAQGLYNNGYRLFVNTATQEIFTISNSGALTLVGRGKFDGTTVDINTAQGDTTIAEAVTDLDNAVQSNTNSINTIQNTINGMSISGTWTPTCSRGTVTASSGVWYRIGKLVILCGQIQFGSNSTTYPIFIDETSLPSIDIQIPFGGVGRITGSNPSNLVISTSETNANLWVTDNNGAVKASDVSNKLIVFSMVGYVE